VIWNEEYETMSREGIEQLQLHRLQSAMKWAYDQVPFYHQRFKDEGVSPKDIRVLEDLRKMPFTTKDDLRQGYPYGMFAVPLDKVVRIHSSSGTKGKPVVAGYTKGDINTWAELVARLVTAGGVMAKDVAQIAFGYGLFTGGFGLHYGLERVGATVIPASAGNTQRQIMLMQDFGTTVLVSTPSYGIYMAEVGKDMGVDFSRMPLRVGLFGAEPCSERLREEIEKRLGITATDNYGLTEVMGPGVAGECLEKNGLHINEDHFIAEVINPATGEVLALGEEGELVFTSLTKEAFPIIRFRTRDISCLNAEPCSCGRTFRKMAKVTRRTDDMFIIRGVNVFPSQIEEVLMEIEGIEPHYQIILDRHKGLDELNILVEVSERIFPDAMKKLVEFEENVKVKLHDAIGINAKIKLVEPRTVERTSGKAKRVIDRRET
jgi:phenylacetate-CoA ligase